MNAMIVQLEDKPGSLAHLAQVLGDAGVNIETGAGLVLGAAGGFGFIADDEHNAMAALDGAGITCRMVEVVMADVKDEPGGLAAVARRLADAGVNLELVVPARIGGERMGIAFGVSDAAAARAALGITD